ncbi:hypothetical protein OSB04_014003 [Centaurea solstitialis]|uniref:Uncharacterized protein n=1 Tax=Centaurea solstitialis TaxID=347529 RepID=A0AA38TG33_9ASTR|nr:hypothetical protein OSB04_014003 [Centaurea solstitialis]
MGEFQISSRYHIALLPTQVLEIEGEVNSRKSKTDFSHGRFQVRMLPSGNLILNTRDLFTMLPLDAYYISGTSYFEILLGVILIKKGYGS